MGWTGSKRWTTKAIIVEAILKEDSSIENYRLIGNELWTIKRGTIVLYLLEKSDGYGWAYKDIGESEGPCYYSCPKFFLKLCPVKNQSWRDKVNSK